MPTPLHRSAVAFGLVLAGCGGSPRAVTPVVLVVPAPTRPAPIERSAPKPADTLDVQFAQGVRLVGYSLAPAKVHADDEVTLTLFWKRETTIDGEWLFFAHVEDERSSIVDDPKRVPVISCAIFEVCPYELRFRAPKDAAQLKLFAGLWRGAERLSIVRGNADANQRAIVGTIPIAPR